MTSKKTVRSKRKSPKVRNFPPGSISPINIEEQNKRSKDHDDKNESELVKLFSSKWLEIRKLKQIETESGKSYKRGKFSKLDEDLARTRISKYLTEHSISEEDFKEELFNQKGQKQFKKLFIKVAKALPGGRPVITVYHYIRRLFHPGNKQDGWLPEEDLHLKRLFVIHGPQWEVISKEIGRSNNSCRDRYRLIREQFSKGPWSTNEIDLLKTAVGTLRNNSSESDNSFGAWAWISEQVKTRSWHQCLTKWTNSLSFKEKHPDKKCVRWTKEQDLILLNRIYDLSVEDESEVVWIKLIDDTWSIWTPMRLRMRWKLLRKRVRNERNLGLDSIIESLINSINVLTPSKHDSQSSEVEVRAD